MQAFELACRWRALNSHFSSWKYDYFKFKGRVRGMDYEKFQHHKDKWAFEKLSKRYDAEEFLVTAVLEKPSQWIGDSVRDSDLEDTHRQRRRRVEALSVYVEEQLSFLNLEEFDKNFVGDPPPLLYHYWGKRVSREVASVLAELAGAHRKWKESFDWMVSMSSLQLAKYYHWTYCDQKKIASIIVRRCQGDK